MEEVIGVMLLILITVAMCVMFYAWLIDYMHRIMELGDRLLEDFIRRVRESINETCTPKLGNRITAKILICPKGFYITFTPFTTGWLDGD